ncbi:MAG: neuraminidase-like domain-containing protein [Candidatus Angelobacter sp.]
MGLASDEIKAIFTHAGATVTTLSYVENGQMITVPSFTLTNLSICYRYSALAKCLQLSVKDMIALKAMASSYVPSAPPLGLDPFHPLSGNSLSVLTDDVLFNQTLLFVKEVAAVQNSGFTVDDLQYLLRQKFDPVGKYQTDSNTLMVLVQSIANGLRQIQKQNAVPANLMSMAESLIDQTLSTLFPTSVLKPIFSLLTNSQTYTGQGTFATGVDPAPFAQETGISFSFDGTTNLETIGYLGYLTDWKKTALKGINAAIGNTLDMVQKSAQTALAQCIANILGVWASMVQYESVRTGVATAIPSTILTQTDAAINLSYDQADQLQWVGYRGVLTDAKKTALLAVNSSADFTALLNDLQAQSFPAYSQLIGSILAMWTNVQTYQAAQTGVATTAQIDAAAFFAALQAAQQAGAITDTVPRLQFSYDSGTQTLTCQGVLTASLQTQLAGLVPSTVLSTLLSNVRAQAVGLFLALATNALTVTAADLDIYVKTSVGLDVPKQQIQVKARLVIAFLPLLAQKLSQQLLVQTLAANLSADPSLVSTLITDSALLSDPSNPGKSLLGSFLSVGNSGVSATYYDGAGNVLTSGIALTIDTSDVTNNKPGTTRAHFEGYLQVSTDGPYRFFAELGDTGATALLQVDAPDPSALLNNAIIPATPAPTTPSEISQFAQLKGGALYHFTVDFSNLGANGAKLLIQGETLSKGPLSQIAIYSEQSFIAFTRARTLLAKVLQILQVTRLNDREISYLVANSSQFNDLRLSSLPTQPADDSPANAVSLFSQFLTLADYADLRTGPAGGTDHLIEVFQSVGQIFIEAPASQNANLNLSTPWTSLANLTRRDAATVRAIAEYFGLIKNQIVGANRQVKAIGDFGNNKGVRRIWEALQLLQIVGIPVTSLTASTVIASAAPPISSSTPGLITENFKNSVKAQYTTPNWQPIAQSVFNNLRQKKRDALVAYLINVMDLENSNQLFEYFLIDPGMESVVQSSRLRLAMSSVQTFVQRCLLNLENDNSNPALNISPQAIDADWWAWMKRYRVWQANREIFLFPENWMEPELRLDKTDLFEQLESNLLQGNVTSDLADDAFFAYLKGLDARARLDIVATYLDQNVSDGSLSTLHVLGRTYGHPHKYFYRTYSTGVWSGWTAVTPDIDGDHIVLAIWKGRLNIFWVTFILQQQPPQNAGGGPTGHVSDLSFDTLAGGISQVKATPQVQVQLHWVEFFQGKWTNPICSDPNSTAAVLVSDGFVPSSVYVHVSKELDANGNEGALRVHLDFTPIYGFRHFSAGSARAVMGLEMPMSLRGYGQPVQIQIGGGGYAFRVTSKNCSPDFSPQYWQAAAPNPYNANNVDATLFTGSGSLSASFEDNVQNSGSGIPDSAGIFQTVHNFAILPCANPVAPAPFLDPTEPLYNQAGALVSPLFYKDTFNPSASPTNFSDELTFFVEPSLSEVTIDQWSGWAITPGVSSSQWSDPTIFDNIPVIAQVPVAGPVPTNPGDPVNSVFRMQETTDWVTDPATAVSFGDSLITKNGGMSVSAPAGLGSSIPGISNSTLGNFGSLLTKQNVVGPQGITLNQLRNIGSKQSSAPAVALATTRKTS